MAIMTRNVLHREETRLIDFRYCCFEFCNLKKILDWRAASRSQVYQRLAYCRDYVLPTQLWPGLAVRSRKLTRARCGWHRHLTRP